MVKLKSNMESEFKLNYFMIFLKAAFIVAMVLSFVSGKN